MVRVLLFLMLGPMSLLPASLLAVWRPRLGAVWSIVTAVGSAMAAILVMAPLPGQAFCDGYYVLKWSLTLILPFSLPMLILGMWLLLAGGDLGLTRRHGRRYSFWLMLILVVLSTTIVMVWFAVIMKECGKKSEAVQVKSWQEIIAVQNLPETKDQAEPPHRNEPTKRRLAPCLPFLGAGSEIQGIGYS